MRRGRTEDMWVILAALAWILASVTQRRYAHFAFDEIELWRMSLHRREFGGSLPAWSQSPGTVQIVSP